MAGLGAGLGGLWHGRWFGDAGHFGADRGRTAAILRRCVLQARPIFCGWRSGRGAVAVLPQVRAVRGTRRAHSGGVRHQCAEPQGCAVRSGLSAAVCASRIWPGLGSDPAAGIIFSLTGTVVTMSYGALAGRFLVCIPLRASRQAGQDFRVLRQGLAGKLLLD